MYVITVSALHVVSEKRKLSLQNKSHISAAQRRSSVAECDHTHTNDFASGHWVNFSLVDFMVTSQPAGAIVIISPAEKYIFNRESPYKRSRLFVEIYQVL